MFVPSACGRRCAESVDVLGFAFPVCECGVVPVVRRLFNKGLPMWVGITFLLAAPVINPIVLVSTYVAFGFGPVLIGRIVFTVIVSIGAGLVFALGARPQDVLQPRSLMPVMGGSGEAPLHFVNRKPLAADPPDCVPNRDKLHPKTTTPHVYGRSR